MILLSITISATINDVEWLVKVISATERRPKKQFAECSVEVESGGCQQQSPAVPSVIISTGVCYDRSGSFFDEKSNACLSFVKYYVTSLLPTLRRRHTHRTSGLPPTVWSLPGKTNGRKFTRLKSPSRWCYALSSPACLREISSKK